jgi:hypothetical protein
MLQIIHSLNINKILKYKTKGNKSFAFIILDNEFSKDSALLRLKSIREIEVERLNDTERLKCEEEYINAIASLSFIYNSREWWANSMSEKNEHVSSHYKYLCLFYCLVKTLKKYYDTQMCIFIVCADEIFEQLKIYCEQNHIKINSLENSIILRFRSIYENVYDLVKIVRYLIKMAIWKMYIPHKLKFRIRKETNNKNSFFVVRSWFDSRFLIEDGNCQDAYFGKLPEYLAHQGSKVIILANFINNYRKIVKKMQDTRNFLIVPEEYYLKYSDIVRSLFYLSFTRMKLKRKISFIGLDVTGIYEKEYAKGCSSVSYISSILRYLVARRFAQSIEFKAYIQTFENYAWEKMTIIGIREVRPMVKILGFQHAFISRNSFKYFPGKMEKGIIPLPGSIITMGKVTKEIMGKYGSYDSDIISIGCALRQEYLSNLVPFQRRNFNKVVVPLTMVSYEAILTIKFLCDSALPKTNIQVVLRCHPSLPFESFKKHIDFTIPDRFIIDNDKSVREELSDTDMVLYTWSTVAIEALKQGLPVIYLDILYPMYVDPLFECDNLKKNVRKPEELLLVVKSYYDMEDILFFKEQERAQGYLREYFYPVNEKNLESFLLETNINCSTS